MDLKEWLEFVTDCVFHLRAENEVQGLACDGYQLTGYLFDVVIDKDGGLVDRQFPATCILSETAVIGHEVGQILCTRLHTEEDGSVHQSDVLRHVGQVFHTVMHGEGDVHHVALLPLAVDSDIGRRAGDDTDGLAIHLYFELPGLHPIWISDE